MPSPGSKARAPCTSRSVTARSPTCSCGSTSRPASSRRSCAAARFTEPPDITARICGICPVAYQMSACNAIEDALRGHGGRAARATCAVSSTAASGSRATPCTSTCSTPPTSSATTEPSRWRPTTAAVVERGLALKKIGNELLETARRAGHPPRQRPGRGLLPGADSSASWRRSAIASCAAATWLWRRSAGSAASTSPTSSMATSWLPSVARTSTPIIGGRIRVEPRPRHRRRRVRRARRRKSTSRIRPRCTPTCSSGATTSSAP